jgi:hypothetical protein
LLRTPNNKVSVSNFAREGENSTNYARSRSFDAPRAKQQGNSEEFRAGEQKFYKLRRIKSSSFVRAKKKNGKEDNHELLPKGRSLEIFGNLPPFSPRHEKKCIESRGKLTF